MGGGRAAQGKNVDDGVKTRSCDPFNADTERGVEWVHTLIYCISGTGRKLEMKSVAWSQLATCQVGEQSHVNTSHLS